MSNEFVYYVLEKNLYKFYENFLEIFGYFKKKLKKISDIFGKVLIKILWIHEDFVDMLKKFLKSFTSMSEMFRSVRNFCGKLKKLSVFLRNFRKILIKFNGALTAVSQ